MNRQGSFATTASSFILTLSRYKLLDDVFAVPTLLSQQTLPLSWFLHNLYWLWVNVLLTSCCCSKSITSSTFYHPLNVGDARKCSTSASLNLFARKCSTSASLNPSARKCSTSASLNPSARKCSTTASLNPSARNCSTSASLNSFARKCSTSASLNPFARKCSTSASLNPSCNHCHNVGNARGCH